MVRETIKKHVEGKEIKVIEVEVEDGKLVYDVEIIKDVKVSEFTVASDGNFLGFEEEKGKEDREGLKEDDRDDDGEREGLKDDDDDGEREGLKDDDDDGEREGLKEDDDDKDEIERIPSSVLAAAMKCMLGCAEIDVKKEKEDGVVYYEIEMENGETSKTFKFTKGGALVEIEPKFTT